MSFTGPHFMMSDYFSKNGVLQQIAGISAKNLIIDTIRKIFRGDSYYPYRDDVYGYPLVVDHTDIPVDSEIPTKIHIGDTFKYEGIYIPSVIVRHGGGSYHPISFNQQGIPGYTGVIQYKQEIVQDGYGEIFEINTPDKYVFAGAWDLSYEIKLYTESTADREELLSIISMGLMHVHWHDLQAAGLLIKNLSFGSESEEEHNNDKFYTQSITLEIYGEWRREIPVGNFLERISFFFDIGRIVDGEVTPPNDLSWEQTIDL